MARRRPPNRLAGLVNPLHLFLAGILFIACFLLQQNLAIRVAQVFLFAGLAFLAGKRIRWGYFILMVGSITVFNLLTPLGEVLLEAGPLVVTRGALRQGLLKGFAIPGLVFISLSAVQPTLRLPGRFGGLVARLFYYFERLLEVRKDVRITDFVGSVDTVLLNVLEDVGETLPAAAGAAGAAVPRGGSRAGGYAILAALATANVAVLVVSWYL